MAVGNSFRDFLSDLKRDELLREFQDSVSPRLEVTNRAWGKGPIFFSNVDGHKCALNILSTRSLLARALGVPAGRAGAPARLGAGAHRARVHRQRGDAALAEFFE